ncbi:DUF3429 domain-containing protein [Sphingomonas sp. SUN039]|uniref:DUF3429 domain-containing protein n=1 Tax=Sphingomonas sp. SUN039 TaxID=2937787 RepID=UPI00216409F5|nr:DUF3429 domain-containing protein [Sphingomonas sp. SUN039]UVO53005.1 DUF3429 domain-containing protein [Sphingomonas sp. SUN039]
MSAAPLPRMAAVLGLAGLLPQIAAVLATFSEADRFIGLAAGYFYAALILSFLGGLWWGVAASRKEAPEWLYVAAVAPSLIAFASGIPWMNGTTWPGPSLVLLGIALLLSILVDRALFQLGLIDKNLLGLRLILSPGLGALTLLLATR